MSRKVYGHRRKSRERVKTIVKKSRVIPRLGEPRLSVAAQARDLWPSLKNPIIISALPEII